MESERQVIQDQAGRLRSEMNQSRTSRSSKLPSRSEVHRNKKKKNKWRIKFPLLKLLSLFFILLPVTIFSLYSYFDPKQLPGIKEESGEGYETINIGGSSEEAGRESEEAEMPRDPETNSTVSQNASAPVEYVSGAAAAKSAEVEPKEPAASREGSEPSGATDKHQKESNPQEYKILYHTVQPQETIFRISMTYYKSQDGIPLIREWNGLKGNEIESGQVLKIPIKQ
ncbi:LysM peptidoglycan-binding domain-containing protein [Peribacillus saganii]|uniref:LysM peptidoglycan-binding domain-containing protein n=1 Tax=Peribacillus saganii TaxID=2303992 RepID=A0A372LBY8_9BACI|nr:LysM peptidoglycan-binding domain-containing protein [Peribacillus saganii]RFU63147.1 LysM peptidoglycan-binding domain-containing protein [Peribacillus saganii]